MSLEKSYDEGMNKSLLIGTSRTVRQHNVNALLPAVHSSCWIQYNESLELMTMETFDIQYGSTGLYRVRSQFNNPVKAMWQLKFISL